MSLPLLVIIVLVQIVFLACLLALLVGRRWMALRRGREDAADRERFEQAVQAFLMGDSDPAVVAEALSATRFAAAVASLQALAMRVAGGRWEQLATAARQTEWFARVRNEARSRVWWKRLRAARALSVLASPAELPTVLALVHDPNHAVRLAAALTLRRLPRRELLEAVLGLALEARAVARGFLVEALADPTSDLIQLLLERLGTATDSEEQRTLLDLAGELRIPGLLNSILRHVGSDDLEVRIATARALGAYPHPRSSRSLRQLLADPCWQVRAQSAAALGAIAAAEARHDLRRSLGDENWWVRLRSALALRKLGPMGSEILAAMTPEEDRYAHDIAQYVLRLDPAAMAEFGGKAPVDFAATVGRDAA